jgi:hypothetical protein
VSRDDDIRYAGPVLDYTPGPGSDYAPEKIFYKTPKESSYADVNRLDNLINYLITTGDRAVAALELQLSAYVLPVPASDTRLRQAVAAEWPSGLGEVKNEVSYRLYRYLAFRQTTTAAYIRQRFEASVRDYTGSHGLDLLMLITMITNEARLIQEFKATYIGVVDDKSEYRTIELFIDWAENGVKRLDDFQKLEATAKNITLPANETTSVSAGEARQAQAMFKVKLNMANREVADSIDYLKRNFSDHASTFYGRFLGPALQYRLHVSRTPQVFDGRLSVEAETSANAMDTNLQVAQADQLRRNMAFDKKVGEALDELTRQNVYRNYINQLAPVGQAIAPGVGGTVMKVDSDPVEVAFYESADRPVDSGADVLEAFHGDLKGLEDPLAHPQYLLLAGGTMDGNLELKAGVRVDGIRPKTHQHDGLDGSTQIKGTDIENSTVPPGVIDHEIKPNRPLGLHLLGQATRVVPPGVSIVDATVGWEGDPSLQYEVQTTVIPD